MAELPILPLKTDALLADTSHMSAQEFGAYCRLLFVMWRHGGRIKNSARQLANIAGVPLSTWRRIADTVMAPMIAGDDGKISQKRLTSTWLDVQKIREKRARAANIRHGNTPPEGDAHAHAHARRVQVQKPCTTGANQNQNQIKSSSLVQTDAAPARVAPSQAVPHPPAGSLATARHGGALASRPSVNRVTDGKRPYEVTKAELEATMAAKRTPPTEVDDTPADGGRRETEKAQT